MQLRVILRLCLRCLGWIGVVHGPVGPAWTRKERRRIRLRPLLRSPSFVARLLGFPRFYFLLYLPGISNISIPHLLRAHKFYGLVHCLPRGLSDSTVHLHPFRQRGPPPHAISITIISPASVIVIKSHQAKKSRQYQYITRQDAEDLVHGTNRITLVFPRIDD